MGYDMYWVDVDRDLVERGDAAFEHLVEVNAETSEELKAAGSAWHPLLNPDAQLSEQEQAIAARREAAHDAWAQANPFYFRLNIWGMGICRQVMYQNGMAVHSQPPDRWPDPADYGPSVQSWVGQHFIGPTCRRDPEQLGDTPGLAAYLDDDAAVRRLHGTDQPGLPLHKLGTNDGWHVTPDEIDHALGRAPEVAMWYDRETDRDEPIGWWISWLEYLRGASAHDGFEVW